MDLFKSKNQQAIITERNRAAMYNEFRKSEANDINIQGGAGKWKADAIEKSKGEGSKGGKVIGHTKSGKAVYEKHDPENSKDFNHNDHFEAQGLHKQQWASLYRNSNGNKRDQNKMDAHQAAAAWHSDQEYKKLKGE